MINLGLFLAYIMVAVAALAAFIFPVVYMVKHPEEAKKTLAGIVGVLVIFGLGYLFASGDPILNTQAEALSSGQLKLIGAGLNTFYVLGAAGVIALIASEVMSFFR